MRIERDEEPADDGDEPIAASPVLRVACRPTRLPLPNRELHPATDEARLAVREAATFEAITGLPEWDLARDEGRRRAAQAATRARDQGWRRARRRGPASRSAAATPSGVAGVRRQRSSPATAMPRGGRR